MRPEGHVGKEVTLVVAVEVDLERAADVRLIVRVVVEGHIVDLDRSVVTRRDRKGRSRQADERQASGEGYRLTGSAYESSDIHEFPPREFLCQKAMRFE